MKKMLSLVMTLVMIVSICCSCAASSNTDATPEKDSTTESTKETTTNDASTADNTSEVVRQDSSTPAETETADTSETTENTSDSSLAKLEAVDESEAVAIGLSEQQISEAFAYAAYSINEEYLKANNLTVESLSWDQTAEQWDVASFYLKNLIFYAELEPTTCNDLFAMLKDGFAPNNYLLGLISESLFRYCYYIDNYKLDNLDIFRDDLNKISLDNLTFSEEQLILGEEVAQEISELEAE